jgi:L-seryl-tRNA(Ser) seleniumtransferase
MSEVRTRPPSVDALLGQPGFIALAAKFGRTATRDDLRAVLSGLRSGGGPVPDAEALAALCRTRLLALVRPSLRPVFNLTGTVLHTNLGRAPLPLEALQQIAETAGACTLEYDLGTAGRGHRDVHLESLLCRLTGAEAATALNNNAAAVLLLLNTLARDREAIVSRGELVEIGGSFRIPDIMARAGARLREIGTTNRTHPADFADAIGPGTALAMKVHTSNYEIQGFTSSVPEAELAALCRAAGIPFVNDLGSGTLVDLSRWGLPREPTVRDAVMHADLVTFSGDKLLGGAQCGCIVGRADLIRRNPLTRALRLGKLTLAAMEAVLRLYLNPDSLAERLPALRLLVRKEANIAAAAHRVQPYLSRALGPAARVTVEPCASQIGSGALPLRTLPSACLAIAPETPGRGEGRWLERTAAAFRTLPCPVIGYIGDGALRFDLRTLEDEAGFLAQCPAIGPAADGGGW